MGTPMLRWGRYAIASWVGAATVLAVGLEAGAFTTFAELSREKPDLELMVLEGTITFEQKDSLTACEIGRDREARAAGFRSIAEDADHPLDVRRWAAMRVAVWHLHHLADPLGAAQIAERWLKDNPDDPQEIRIRCALAEIYEHRASDPKLAVKLGRPPSPEFQPSRRERLEALQRTLVPIFVRHKGPSLDLVNAHWYYAYAVGQVAVAARDEWEFSPEGLALSYAERQVVVADMAVETSRDTLDHMKRAMAMVDSWNGKREAITDRDILTALPGLTSNLGYHAQRAQEVHKMLVKRQKSLTTATTDRATEQVFDTLLEDAGE